MDSAIMVYLGIVLVMSAACLAAYGWDKRQAVINGRRVPERTLHILAFLGGWPGAWMGQRHFRHKTKKLSFLIVFWSAWPGGSSWRRSFAKCASDADSIWRCKPR